MVPPKHLIADSSAASYFVALVAKTETYMKTLRTRIVLLLSAICLLPALAFSQVPQFTVTLVIGPNGTASPMSQIVPQGATAQFGVTPDAGFTGATTMSGDTCNASEEADAKGEWITDAIFANCVLNVSFVPLPSFTVTAVAGPHGSVAPASQVVIQGGFATITVTPDPGYVVAGVSGSTCSASSQDDGTWVSQILEDCELDVSFSLPPQYTVTAVAGPNGSVAPSSQLVEQGAQAVITITPNPGYVYAGFGPGGDGNGCGGVPDMLGMLITDPIGANCEVDTSFVLSTADVVFEGDFDSDIVAVDDLNLSIDDTTLGTSINWLTGAVCHGSCDSVDYDFRAMSSFPLLGHFHLEFAFPIAVPEDSVGVVIGEDDISVPLSSGAIVGPDQSFAAGGGATGGSTDIAAAWRTLDGVDAYLGLRFLNPNSGRINYGYAHLVTAASTSSPPTGFPATIVSYAYDKHGNAITIP